MPPVSEGQVLRVEGDFKPRSMYGRQFTAEKVYVGSPSRLDGIVKFLGSGLIKGISSYKPEKNVRLATYAARCIENAILSQRTFYLSMWLIAPT